MAEERKPPTSSTSGPTPLQRGTPTSATAPSHTPSTSPILTLNTILKIARNRLGLNDRAHEIAKEEAAKEKAKAEREKAKGKKKAKN